MQEIYAVNIRNQAEARQMFKDIGVDSGGYPYMIPKAVSHCVKIKKISSNAANILKQEMLSRGGEAAISREAIYEQGITDVLLIGTIKQYRLLVQKLAVQPFGLKRLVQELQNIVNSLEPGVKTIHMANKRDLIIGQKSLIMGILNVTPDSFSDGGKWYNPDTAVKHGMEMIEQGADIIDIGGASSRPHSSMADAEEELRRVMPVLERLAREDITISVDTFRGKVAEAAINGGAHIINDIGRLQMDETLLPLLVEKQAPVILMHNRLQFNQDIEYQDLIADIIRELNQSVRQAIDAGLKPENIMIDPGIGFGKNAAQNRYIIKQLVAFKGLGYPVLMGMSRKTFIGETLDLPVEDRLEGSLAVLAASIINGADIIRVHDVKESVRVAKMLDAVMRENG